MTGGGATQQRPEVGGETGQGRWALEGVEMQGVFQKSVISFANGGRV